MRYENLLGDRDMRRPERKKGPVSLFRHELEAIQAIERRVSSQKLGYILHNLNIHDKQTNRYFEVDVVIICTFGIYVVELKHWSGIIEVRPYSWVQNKSFFKEDPHKTNNFKAKLLKGLYERRFPTYPS
ncbi:MAG: nuclease-related domain-containing protein, partial [Candidatus Freyarchaeota archaeon]